MNAMFLARHQKVEQNRTVKIDNKSSKSDAKLMHLLTVVRNQN
jgi:hypothetical protein